MATFLAHTRNDHNEAASPALGEIIEKMRLEWVDPVRGASDLPPIETQPLAEGADARRTAYRGLFAAPLQDWREPLRAFAAEVHHALGTFALN